MARPAHVDVVSAVQNWDGQVRDNFDLVFETPYPIPVYDDFASLPTAGEYENCLAAIVDEDRMVYSNGTAWVYLPLRRADAVADLSITMPSDSPADADALRDDLVSNALAEIETKINDLLAELREAEIIDT